MSFNLLVVAPSLDTGLSKCLQIAMQHATEHRFRICVICISFHDSGNHRSVSGEPHNRPTNANQ